MTEGTPMTRPDPGTAEPRPFSPDEIDAMRRWHKRARKSETCMQGDPWPCRTARFLVTLDSVRNVVLDPMAHAKWYGELAAKFEAER